MSLTVYVVPPSPVLFGPRGQSQKTLWGRMHRAFHLKTPRRFSRSTKQMCSRQPDATPWLELSVNCFVSTHSFSVPLLLLTAGVGGGVRSRISWGTSQSASCPGRLKASRIGFTWPGSPSLELVWNHTVKYMRVAEKVWCLRCEFVSVLTTAMDAAKRAKLRGREDLECTVYYAHICTM